MIQTRTLPLTGQIHFDFDARKEQLTLLAKFLIASVELEAIGQFNPLLN